MRKKFCLLSCFAIQLFIVSCSNGSIQENIPKLTVSSEMYESISDKYYNVHQQLDDSYLYVSPEADYCIQLPYSAHPEETFSDNGEYIDFSTVNILSVGSLSVSLNDTSYKKSTADDIYREYNDNKPEEGRVSYEVLDFKIITDGNNNEIGRKYILQNSEGVKILKKEYDCNEKTMSVTGIPFDNEVCFNVLESYFESFEKIYLHDRKIFFAT